MIQIVCVHYEHNSHYHICAQILDNGIMKLHVHCRLSTVVKYLNISE